MSTYINTEVVSNKLRNAAISLAEKSLLITSFHNTEQEEDLTEAPNCEGFGRIRHFKRDVGIDWPPNPLPIGPACKALNLPYTNTLRAQVFQTAVCNWRCWYCFVPFNLLAANPKYSAWVEPKTLIDLYLSQSEPPAIIDLSGGQPDLTPEWVPWMMTELRDRGIDQKVYLWSDDNLSSDFFWRYLSDTDLELISSYANYGRVCCFKGFNTESFTFNTKAHPELFEKQFELMGRLLRTGIDLYAYATFTTPSSKGIADDMKCFIDHLQTLDENLPLRTVPLEIQIFSPVKKRINDSTLEALQNQYLAIKAWKGEIESRYSQTDRDKDIAFVNLTTRRS